MDYVIFESSLMMIADNKVGVLDAVERFRAGNMSGYVTVYSDLRPAPGPALRPPAPSLVVV